MKTFELPDDLFRVYLDLNAMQQFAYSHGLFHCKILQFRTFPEILRAMADYDADFDISENESKKIFVQKNAGKQVLARVIGGDIFVCGDDNIPFRAECFF